MKCPYIPKETCHQTLAICIALTVASLLPSCGNDVKEKPAEIVTDRTWMVVQYQDTCAPGINQSIVRNAFEVVVSEDSLQPNVVVLNQTKHTSMSIGMGQGQNEFAGHVSFEPGDTIVVRYGSQVFFRYVPVTSQGQVLVFDVDEKSHALTFFISKCSYSYE